MNDLFMKDVGEHVPEIGNARTACLKCTDAVEKVFWGNKRNFLKLLMRFVRSDVRDPHRFSEKRPRTFVSTLKSIARAE